MKRMNFPRRREQRREDAAVRDKHRQQTDTATQLFYLDGKPGEAKRERARLAK